MSDIEVRLIDSMGSDLSVANAARVSFAKESEMEDSLWGPPSLKEKDAKLIRFLAKHKHLSPFGHCFATFRVKAPIFVARQLVKHKFLRWNEVSRRYVDDEPEFYVPDVWRGRSADKKQGSDGVVDGVWDLEVVTGALHTDEWGELSVPYESVTTCTMNFMEAQMRFYSQLLEHGVAPEQARMVLPQSTMTEYYWSGSLDAFADMCKLRCARDTQGETRIVADMVYGEMVKLFPTSWEALLDDGD